MIRHLEVHTKAEPLPESLAERLFHWAEVKPQEIAVRFLAEGEDETARFTFGELDQEARKVAAILQANTDIGDRILLCFPPGVDFVAAFTGCFYSGRIAVPIYPPGNQRSLPRVLTVLNNSGSNIILTDSASEKRFSQLDMHIGEAPPPRIIATDSLGLEWVGRYQPYRVAGDDVAFLQYTSGSTGSPKGVMVTHRNLIANIQMLLGVTGATSSDQMFSWLPIYHDMGLIGALLQAVYAGIPTTLMPPAEFVMRPIRWLRAISKYRGSVMGVPNFALDLACKKVNSSDLSGLDLTCLTSIVNASEPVREQSMNHFTELLEKAGFSKRAFNPSYGLAEATLIVSGVPRGEYPRSFVVDKVALEKGLVVAAIEGHQIASCGKPCPEVEIAIVSPETLNRVPRNQVGEIWVAGPNVALGYWNNKGATQQTFGASLPGENKKFLRTGDLGFMFDGELYVTGRLKDLIIVNGRNLYPQDVELTAERADAAIRKGCVTAFGVDNNSTQEMAVVAEIERTAMRGDLAAIAEKVTASITQEFEITPSYIIFLKHGGLPKTTSGKLQRKLTAKMWKEGSLDKIFESRRGENIPVAEVEARTNAASVASPSESRQATEEKVKKAEPQIKPPVSHIEPTPPTVDGPALQEEIENNMRKWIAKSIQKSETVIERSKPFTSYGVDSLAAYELICKLEETYDFKVPSNLVWDYPTIQEAAQFIAGIVAKQRKRNAPAV